MEPIRNQLIKEQMKIVRGRRLAISLLWAGLGILLVFGVFAILTTDIIGVGEEGVGSLFMTGIPRHEQVVPTVGRDGSPVVIPENIERIITIAPSNTEIVSAIGFGYMIVAADIHSASVEGISAGLFLFDETDIDAEVLAALDPDIVFAPYSLLTNGENPLAALSEMGVAVLYIPHSESIDEIIDDIMFVAAALSAWNAGDLVVRDLRRLFEFMGGIPAHVDMGFTSLPGRVYFETGAEPSKTSVGSGTFLNEFIEMAGASNIFSGEQGRIYVTNEQVLYANPDVIITSASYAADPIGEIKSRPGWNNLSAVQNNRVYVIDADVINRSSQSIVYALHEIMAILHPNFFDD